MDDLNSLGVGVKESSVCLVGGMGSDVAASSVPSKEPSCDDFISKANGLNEIIMGFRLRA